MTPIESAQILAVLTAAYPNAYKNLSGDEAAAVAVVWASQFPDVPYDIVFMALQKAISTCKYPPTICEVKEKLSNLHWEAYEALRVENSEKTTRECKEEYRRIYELTDKFSYKDEGPELREMLPYSRQALNAGMIEGN